jgi:hypothetical protein
MRIGKDAVERFHRARRDPRLLFMRRVVVGLVLALALGGCSGVQGSEAGMAAVQQEIQQRLDGPWRLTSYVPDQTLSPAMLLSLQTDSIVVTFDQGRIRTSSIGLQFDRGYRIAPMSDDTFKLFIRDDQGIEYESVCRFDNAGNLDFQTFTSPWTGRGKLQREGGAAM